MCIQALFDVELTMLYRVAGTVDVRPVRRAVDVMWLATAAPSASTKTGRTTTMCAESLS